MEESSTRKYVIGLLGWNAINTVRASFLSKAITVFSLSVTILGQAPVFMQILGSGWKIRVILIGAVFFLIGYLLPFFKATPEFRIPRTKREIVADWCLVTGPDFFQSRKELLQKLLDRFSSNPPFDVPKGIVEWAKIRLLSAQNFKNLYSSKGVAAQLYDAELELRSYDQPALRVIVSMFLLIGCLLMSANLIMNVYTIIFIWP